MSEFATSGSVVIEVDQGSLRDVRKDVEQSIGSVTVDAQASTGRARGRTDGGTSTLAMAGGASVIDELSDQTDYLSDILDELEKMGGSGGPGGGGGGGIGGGGLLAGLGLLGTGVSASTLGIGGTLAVGGVLSGFGAQGIGQMIAGSEREDLGFMKGLGSDALLEGSGLLGTQGVNGDSYLTNFFSGMDMSQGKAFPSVEELLGMEDQVGSSTGILEFLGVKDDTGEIGTDLSNIPAPEWLTKPPSWLDQQQSKEARQTADQEAAGGPKEGGPQSTSGEQLTRRERAIFNQTTDGSFGQSYFRGGPETTGGVDISREERAIFNNSGAVTAGGRGGQQMRFTTRVQNQIVNSLDMSNMSQLQNFLRDPEGFMRREIDLDRARGR